MIIGAAIFAVGCLFGVLLVLTVQQFQRNLTEQQDKKR